MENYIQYLEQVLGLKNIVWPQMEPVPEPVVESEPAPSVWVLFIAEKKWSAPAAELFKKMREAMKLTGDQVKILFANQASLPELQISALSAQRVVCFSKRLNEQISSDPAFKYVTFDPEELLAQPQLKKAAWEDLKIVMKSLGLL
jgi:hypothetical protein